MVKGRKVYLDYAATTPVDPRVVAEMMPYLSKEFGNTESLHEWGERQRDVLERSRADIAKLIGAGDDEVVFTASATESNNLALKGTMTANRQRGNHLVISEIEHDCVLNSARWLEKEGYRVSRVGVDRHGLVDMEKLQKLVGPETVMVSIIHGNNEIGVIQDIEKIGSWCRERGVYFHTDASQSFGKKLIDVEKMKIDLLTASSHKIYGPKGAAILYVRKGVRLEPIIHGGGQEGGLRSGTVNVAAIAGMAAAAKLAYKEREEEETRISKLRDKLIYGILDNISGTQLNGPAERRLSNNANISFEYVEGESLALELSGRGVACSTGSACSSRSLEPSHVLLALGLDHKMAHGSLRFSLGRWTTKEDIDYVLQVLPEVVEKFRIISPFKKDE